jgi:hypothetical protein
MTSSAYTCPVIHVWRGSPTDEELAALAVVLMAAASADQPVVPAATTSGWTISATAGMLPAQSWQHAGLGRP